MILHKLKRSFRLSKKQDQSLDEEKQSLDENVDKETLTLEEVVSKNCKILYKDGYACWQCREGWHDLLADLSYKIEALHLQFYRKYRVRAQVSECKEKFGTLHLIVTASIDPPAWKCFISRLFNKIYEKLHYSIDYGFTTITDIPYHIEHVERELSYVDYIKEKRRSAKCANVRVFERNGKYFYVADYAKYPQTHKEPTKHLILYKVQEFCRKVGVHNLEEKPSKQQEIICRYVNSLLKQWTSEVEKESYNVCEVCGSQIGEEWSPRCETRGWVSYICKSCAEKQDSDYYMNGELWSGDKRIKTKAELDEEAKALEAKEAEMRIKYEQEEAEYEKELAAAKEEMKKKEEKTNEDQK